MSGLERIGRGETTDENKATTKNCRGLHWHSLLQDKQTQHTHAQLLDGIKSNNDWKRKRERMETRTKNVSGWIAQ